jgi:hypothetical protein
VFSHFRGYSAVSPGHHSRQRYAARGEQPGVGIGEAGGLLRSSGRAGEGDLVDPAELGGDGAPDGAGAAFHTLIRRIANQHSSTWAWIRASRRW